MSEDIKKRRAKGEGSIQQLAKDKWKTQITIGYDSEGNRRTKSFTAKTQKEVVAMKNKFLKEKQEGTLVFSNTTTVAELTKRWLSIKEDQIKGTTYHNYESAFKNHILPAIGELKIQKITVAHLNDYFKAKRKQGIATSSIQHHKVMLSGIFEFAREEGLVARNLVDSCNPVRGDHTARSVFNKQQMKVLLDYVRTRRVRQNRDHILHYLYYILLLFLGTGMRRGEILGLQWNDIDFDKNSIKICRNVVRIDKDIVIDTPKTKSSYRVVAVDHRILEELKELPQDGPWVFHGDDKNHLIPDSVGRALKRAVRELGLPEVTLHGLRHTHATHLIASGLDIKSVSARLGHATIKTTLDLYAHALPEKDREAADTMGSWLL